MGEHFASRRLQAGTRSLTSPKAHTALVIPDVSGIEAEFDYSVPAAMTLQTGDLVRVPLHGRKVRGWVVDPESQPPDGITLRDVSKFSSRGPSAELIELAGWAAQRWAGRRSFFLQTASPPRNIVEEIVQRPSQPSDNGSDDTVELQVVSPTASALESALDADDRGPALIVVPSQRLAERLGAAMRKHGRRIALVPDEWARAAQGGTTVIGTRSGAWAPCPDMRCALVIDAHDEALRSEASPTWNAVDVVIERARRKGIPCKVTSPTPPLDLLRLQSVTTSSNLRRGWAPLHVIDLRRTDPRTGLYPERTVELIRSGDRVVCVLNRKGRARLLGCKKCNELARCERCSGAVGIEGNDFVCSRCQTMRPVICTRCGSSGFKVLRVGVNKAREELEALARRRVGEVTGETTAELPGESVLIGTEAVLNRVGRADAVVFLDFDQELSVPRQQAGQDALVLLARASRIVGGHERKGMVVVQTRQPEHEVVQAALHGCPLRFLESESKRHEELGWPPFVAQALISGSGAAAYVDELRRSRATVLGPLDGRYLLQAPTHRELSEKLTSRPKGTTVRIEVDPRRI